MQYGQIGMQANQANTKQDHVDTLESAICAVNELRASIERVFVSLTSAPTPIGNNKSDSVPTPRRSLCAVLEQGPNEIHEACKMAQERIGEIRSILRL